LPALWLVKVNTVARASSPLSSLACTCDTHTQVAGV
jgi:hypothetical protein